MNIVPGKECFERIRTGGGVWTAVDNWGGEIQQDIRINDGDRLLRHRQARDSSSDDSDEPEPEPIHSVISPS